MLLGLSQAVMGVIPNVRLLFTIIFASTALMFIAYCSVNLQVDVSFSPTKEISVTDIPTTTPPLKVYSNPCTGYSPRKCIRKLEHEATAKPRSLMTAECDGRLGNQMFSYAYLYAFVTYNQGEGYMSKVNSNLISKYFKVSLDTMDFNLSSSIQWTFHSSAPENFKFLSKTRNHKFRHKPLVIRYFEDISPQIRREFQFHDEIQKMAEDQLAKAHLAVTGHENHICTGILRPQYVGVHVRRSDYQPLTFPITAGFYHSAMMYFQSKYANTIFIVASEDLVWCKQNFAPFANDGLRIYYLEGVSEDNGGLDLAVLVNCDHLIFGVGSFGFWAGYLNSGEVVYCSDCIYKDGIWQTDPGMYDQNYTNFVKPSWKGMSNS